MRNRKRRKERMIKGKEEIKGDRKRGNREN
jgi:hypothetical protein